MKLIETAVIEISSDLSQNSEEDENLIMAPTELDFFGKGLQNIIQNSDVVRKSMKESVEYHDSLKYM